MRDAVCAIERGDVMCGLQSLSAAHLFDNFEVLSHTKYFNALTTRLDSAGQLFVRALKVHHQLNVLSCTAALLHRTRFASRFNNHFFPIGCFFLCIFIHLDAHHKITLWKIAIQSHARRIGSSTIQVGEHFDQDVTNRACLLLEEDACDATNKRNTSFCSQHFVLKQSCPPLDHS